MAGTFNIKDAITYLDGHAYATTQSKCAKYVRLALEAGGIHTTPNPVGAKDYGPYLTQWGFKTLPFANYSPLAGDIRVFQPYKGGSKYGHIDMYNGTQWVSDFREPNEFPGNGYRSSAFEIFRWSSNE